MATDPPTIQPHTASPDDWRPCQAGEVASILSQQRAVKRENRRRARTRHATLALGVLVMLVLIWPFPNPSSKSYGGLSCREVLELDEPFVQHELDEDLQLRIQQHLEDCPRCLDHMQTVRTRLEALLSGLLQRGSDFFECG